MKSHSARLGQMPILPLIWKMSAPSVVSMLVIASYHLVDAIFIGRFVGPVGLAALASTIPAIFLFMGLSLFIGVGGGTAVSRTLGKADTERANRILGTMLFMVLVLGVGAIVVAFIGTKQILLMTGASEQVLEPASQYLSILLLGGPLSIFTMAMNNLVRSEGNAPMAMFSMVTGAVVNVLLDPLFIYHLGFGMRGAAMATVGANLVTTGIMTWYLYSGKSSLALHFSHIRFRVPIAREIAEVGVSTLVMHTSGCLIQSFVIRILIQYGGETAVSVYGMCNRTVMFIFMPIFGLQAGALPIIGYNFGARLIKRAKQTIFYGMFLASLYLLVLWMFIQLFPSTIIGAFTNDPVLLGEGVSALEKLGIAIPVVGIPVMIVGTFQALGKAKYALFLTMNRTFFLVIPLLLILPPRLGVDGVWYAFPIADAAALVINATCFLWALRKVEEQPELRAEPRG